jgi:hypothetical protein
MRYKKMTLASIYGEETSEEKHQRFNSSTDLKN